MSLPSAPETKVAMVAAVPMTLKVFMAGLLAALAQRVSVTALCHADAAEMNSIVANGVAFRPVGLERKIRLWRDGLALLDLLNTFRQERYALVHSITPKAGLIAMTAAFLCRVPVRMHVFTGQVWATRRGFKRWALKSLDRLLASLATHVVADSASQRQFLIDEGVVSAKRIRVLGQGSISGVDVQRFCPNPELRQQIRGALQIPDDAVVALYLGRMNREKGILDLAAAFVQAAEACPNLYWILVGPDEEGLTGLVTEILGPLIGRVRFVGMTPRPEDYMATADFFCLPSYREGFGSVVIEAAASGIPSLASRIYGITDAVVEGQTGLLHTVGAVPEIAAGLQRLAMDSALRQQLGQAARQRALREFSSTMVVQAWLDYYAEALASRAKRYN